MPVIVNDFVRDLTLDVFVGVDLNTVSVGTVRPPNPLNVRGLIDTGANHTSVSPAVLTQLGIPSHDKSPSTTAAGVVMVDLFMVCVGIPAGGERAVPVLWAGELEASAFAVQLAGIDVLIGMDLLSLCRLWIHGPAKKFWLDI